MKTTFAISHRRWLSAPAGVAVASLLVVAQVAAQPLSAEPDAPPEVAAATDIPWVYVTVGGGLQTRPPRLSQLLVFDDAGDPYGGRVSSAAAWEASSYIVTDVEFVHSYPYAAAEYGSAVSSTRTAQTLGYHVGADVSWYFTGHFGAGVLVRWTAAPVSLVPLSRGAVAPLDIDLGGLYAAAGVRVRF